MKRTITSRLLFPILSLSLSLCKFSVMGQVVQKTPMAQWHYTGYNTTVSQPNDWIFQVLPTEGKEYIAVGYTKRTGNGVVPVIMKLSSLGKPVWIKPIIQLQEGASIFTGNLDFAYFQQVIKTPKGYAAAGKGKNRFILVEVDEAGNQLYSQTAFTPGTALGSAVNSAAFCLAMNPAKTEFILGGQFQYTIGGPEYACLTKIGYATRSIISTKVFGSTYGSYSQTGGNNFYKLLVKPGAGSNYIIYAAGCKSMSGDNDSNNVANSDGTQVPLWQRNKDMWLLKADQNLNSTWEKTFNKSSVSYNEPLYYSETGPFSARDMATNLNSAGHGLAAADLLKSSVNQDERAFDMIFTGDGKIALIGLVNHVAVYTYQYGNGDSIIKDGGGFLDKVRLDGSSSSHYIFDEYMDGDAYLLKIDTGSGSLIWSKNVSHFSSKDFYPQVHQQCGNFIIGGSTADYSTPYGLVDYFDALLVATADNSTPGHLWRRAYHPVDAHVPGAHQSKNMCLFSMEPTADGGFVIGGDHNITAGTYDDHFSITKFAPFSNAQKNFDIHSGNNDLFPIGGPSTFTWNYVNYRVGAKIIVPAGKTLNINNSSLHFAASDQVRDYSGFQPWDKNDFIGIAVEPGGRLNITNSILLGAGEDFCDRYYMWDGIIVNGQPAMTQTAGNQGSLTITNSTIRDAIYGIAVSETNRDYVNETTTDDGAVSNEFQSFNAGSRYRVHGEGGGGRISADRNTFLNCVFSVNHQRYPTPGLGLAASFSSSYYGNKFVSEATGIADKTQYHSAGGGPRPGKSYLAVWAVDKIQVTDNNFTSDASFFPEDRPYGVVSGDGGFTITRKCSTVDIYGNCIDPSPGPGNTFTNLFSAVDMKYSPDYSSRSLRVTYNTFDNNFRSVSVVGSMNGLTANYNIFKIPELLVSPSGGQPQGITLASSTGYSVQYNNLDKCATCGTGGLGIVINTGDSIYDNVVRNNTMNNLYWGAVANQSNGGDDRGLQFKCNVFQNGMNYAIVRSSTALDTWTTPATMRKNQGDCDGSASGPAGNQFLHGCLYGTAPRKLFSDAFVSQQVIYNANSFGTVYDPSGCVSLDYTVNNCNAPTGTACPGDYGGSAGYAEMKELVDSLDGVLDSMSTASPEYTELRWQQNILISDMARWQGQNEQADSAANLMAAYHRYAEAIPFYLQAGNFRAAWDAWANLPDTTEDQLDYIWLTDKAISQAENSQGWQQLGSSNYSALLGIAVKNSFSGFMAAGVADFLGLRPIVWPSPVTDTGSLGARPGNDAGNSGSSFIGNDGKMESLQARSGISVYPNPTTGAVTVSMPESGSLSLLNIQGQQVADYQLSKGENHLRMPAGIAPGIYIGRLVYGSGKYVIIRIAYQP